MYDSAARTAPEISRLNCHQRAASPYSPELNLRLRGRAGHSSQTFRSDAVAAAAAEVMRKIEELRRTPVPESMVPEKELWRRQALYLMPKPYPRSGAGLNPNFPPTSELSQRELIRAWENVLLLDENDPEAMMHLGACLIGFDQARACNDPKKVAQWIAGSRLVERALSVEPTRDRAATYYNCIQQFLCWKVAPRRSREMAQYVLDHPGQCGDFVSGHSIKIALTMPAQAADNTDFARFQAALSNAKNDQDAVMLVFPPGLTRDFPLTPFTTFLTPYLDSPDPLVQFVVQRAMGELLCWGKRDPAALEHFDKAIAVTDAAYRRCRTHRGGLNNIYRLRIEACEYLGLSEEVADTAWAGARHFLEVGRIDPDFHLDYSIGWLYEFCVTKAMKAGEEKEAIELCNAYLAGAEENWQQYDGWPRVAAKPEELLARLAGKTLPDMSRLRRIMEADSLLGQSNRELAAMRMAAAAGKLWFVLLSSQNDRRRLVYDPGRHEVSEVYGLCAGGGKLYVAFRGPPQSGIAVLDPATGRISILAPSSRDASREQEPIDRMQRLLWDAVTPRLYACGYENLNPRPLLLTDVYGWSPQDRTWQRHAVEEAPRFVVSDGGETLVVRVVGERSEFHFVKANQTVSALVPLPRLMGEPAWDGHRIWVPTASGLYEIDRATAEVRWLAYQDGSQFLSLLKTGGRLYVAASRGLYCYGEDGSTEAAAASLVDSEAKFVPLHPEPTAAKPAGEAERRPPPRVSGPATAAGKGSRQVTWFSAGPAWRELNMVVRPHRIHLTSLNHGAAPYRRILSQSEPGSTIVLLFALDDSDKNVPAEYADLLPVPWAQIEPALRKGETVEIAGESRERKVVLLAAPTVSQLKALMHSTKLLAVNRPGNL